MTSQDWKNKLYFGDNLDILREHVADESVDLIYLDPPFNSNANYNVLFQEKGGEQSAAQITAFEDTWGWGQESEYAYHEVVTNGPKKLGDLLQAMLSFLGRNDMMAYITMMAQRMAELHRVLKPTGSIYLHCDPTASHYLKVMMDGVFGPQNFRTEIIWKRSAAHSDAKQGRKLHGRTHDVILFYTKSGEWIWNTVYTPYDEKYVEMHYPYIEPGTGRQFQPVDLTAAKPGGDTSYEWRIRRPKGENSTWMADLANEYLEPRHDWEYKGVGPSQGRYWAYSRENMERFAHDERIYYTGTGTPRYKQYLDEMPGVPLQDIWIDIPPINSQAKERLGYPTQKPEVLLERIITASSNEGDVILDPFCGCGTAITAAERLNRRWMGIDITHLAIALIRHRLHDAYKTDLRPYEVIGDPKDLSSAESLFQNDPYKFEWWALGLVDARPAQDKRRGADSGIDGYINFFDDNSGKAKRVIVQVKGGHVSVPQVRDLKGVLEREKAQIGLFITLRPPTGPMTQEAASAGFYEPEHYPGDYYPRIQILTIEELLSGKHPEYPRVAPQATFRQAPRRRRQEGEQTRLV